MTCARSGSAPLRTRNGRISPRPANASEDDSRIRTKPGVFAQLRSLALNLLRANGVGNVSEAIYANALRLDRLLALGAG